jgi:deoxyribodipyrimidine photolyase
MTTLDADDSSGGGGSSTTTSTSTIDSTSTNSNSTNSNSTNSTSTSNATATTSGIDRTVPPVSSMRGGTRAAQNRLCDFLLCNLERYATGKGNNPSKPCTSLLVSAHDD